MNKIMPDSFDGMLNVLIDRIMKERDSGTFIVMCMDESGRIERVAKWDDNSAVGLIGGLEIIKSEIVSDAFQS